MIFRLKNEFRTKKEIVEAYPEAIRIAKVEGGWMIFFSIAEYETWLNQK